jgi:rhodanese-related sulfurtransferase
MIKKFLALAVLCLCTLAARAGIINIDNTELARLVASGVPVIDIRTEGEWKETGVIAGSRLLTFFDENGRSNPPQWLEKLKPIAKPEQPVILVCRSGNRTRAAAQFLAEQAGYKTVYNVSHGIKAWAGDARPLVSPSSSMAVCAAGTRC